ncbi:hypothetical protein DBR24_27050 [Pseudomonas sp. HMWF006]|nr:hypothetical protein DBR24_27050 [Pseudomonas sp. HMWF006]PTT68254.1 hypothetical protein DBR26_13665 [Pseudomonas sp. HMWF007]PTT94500.1 hypothetical protein DBR29_03460 [Pseudomonas sp. HMWF005]
MVAENQNVRRLHVYSDSKAGEVISVASGIVYPSAELPLLALGKVRADLLAVYGSLEYELGANYFDYIEHEF